MTFQLVAHVAGARSVELWLTNFDGLVGDGPLELFHQRVAVDLAFGSATVVRDGLNRPLLETRRALVARLAPSTDHRFEVRRNGRSLASATVTTPPLVGTAAEPFSLLLASCFDVRNSESNLVASCIDDVRTRHNITPHLQVFCGDQVYVDSTALLSAGNIEEHIQDAYRSTWSGGGLGEVFASSANVFTPDDHELWNNAPRYAPLLPGTCATENRFQMSSVATRFFAAVQSRQLVQSFEMGGVPFFVADTRLRRRHDLTEFLPRGAFERLRRWVRDLEGPGVLVLGQPIIDEPRSPFKSVVVDAHLSSYERQYRELLRILDNARHDTLVLSGDVHFGRIAEVTTSRNRTITEIISSPTALVNPLAASKPPLPFEWPPRSGSDFTPLKEVSTVSSPLSALSGFEKTREHFMTLRFEVVAQGFDVRVKAWTVNPTGAAEEFDHSLTLGTGV